MSARAYRSAPWIAVLAVIGALAFGTVAGPSKAQDASVISVENALVRLTIPGRPAAGYVMIRNAGANADAVVSASSPMAERVELHTHLMENGVMKMRQVEKVDVPAKGKAEFKPGGFHLMIFGLKSGIKPGDTLPLTLTLEKAGNLETDFQVEGLR